ncbi:MAG: hypothetical protein H6R00_249 [Proteobacteria bacterium]|nr:hypothetical protein [Pseudomonadota bacterium]
MTQRREWRSSGLSAPPLNPADEHRGRAPSSASQGADQAGMNAKVDAAAGGCGQAIHIVDEFKVSQRFRRLATLFATLKIRWSIFKMLMRKGKMESRNAATPATGSRAHMETSFACSRSWLSRMLYARVGRCSCCTVAKTIKRYINQILSISDLQHRRFLDRCSRCRTIKYPEISSYCLSGGLNG